MAVQIDDSVDIVPINRNLNSVFNAPLNSNLIDTLNRMEFTNIGKDRHVNCEYIMPNNLNWGGDDLLTILHANIRSMKTNFDNFSAEFLSPSKSPDIIGFCETRLSDETQSIYSLENYNFYSTNISRDKGGVCMYVSNRFHSKVRNDLCFKKEYIESIFAECYVNGKKLLLGVVYHRPGTSYALFQHELNYIIEQAHSHCIIMGDLNVNILNDSNADINNFVSIFKEYSFFPVITKPTRVTNTSATLLDHIWINFEQSKGYSSKIAISSVTDHFPGAFYYALSDKQSIFKSLKFLRSS